MAEQQSKPFRSCMKLEAIWLRAARLQLLLERYCLFAQICAKIVSIMDLVSSRCEHFRFRKFGDIYLQETNSNEQGVFGPNCGWALGSFPKKTSNKHHGYVYHSSAATKKNPSYNADHGKCPEILDFYTFDTRRPSTQRNCYDTMYSCRVDGVASLQLTLS